MYRERPSRVGGATVWWTAATSAAEKHVLPDGCMDLIWNNGDLLVAGPDTRAHVFAEAAGTSRIGIRFAPGTGPAVFGVPAHELRDQRVPLTSLWPANMARRLADRLAAAPDRASALEAASLERLADVPPDPVCAAVVAALAQGSSVSALAHAIGVSERHLHRRCRAAFGYGPKTLAKVLRLQHALDLARNGVPLATVAATTGYADQSHLSNDVKTLVGMPIRQVLAATG
jgi:AraC-like DNA-binding protein